MDSLIVSQCYKNPTKKRDSATEKNFKATCKFCPSRVISGNINNSSNFLKHIQKQHSIEFKKFQLVSNRLAPERGKTMCPSKQPIQEPLDDLYNIVSCKQFLGCSA